MNTRLLQIDNMVVRDSIDDGAARLFRSRLRECAMVSWSVRNAAGKTTLMRFRHGTFKPAQGAIRFDGTILTRIRPRPRGVGIGTCRRVDVGARSHARKHPDGRVGCKAPRPQREDGLSSTR